MPFASVAIERKRERKRRRRTVETSGASASVPSRDNKRGIERELETGCLLSRIETVTVKGETMNKDRKNERE